MKKSTKGLLVLIIQFALGFLCGFLLCKSCTKEPRKAEADAVVISDQVHYKVDLSTGSVARSIADSTGARVETLWSCHVISADDFKNGETYLSLMQRNLSALERGCMG